MKSDNVKQVMKRIRGVAYHVGVFEQSFPKVLKGARAFTRSHLVVLRDCLPDLKRLLRYVADTVPSLVQVVGLADRGTTDLVKASATLQEVRRSTEQAVSEIFGVLDRVDPLLAQASEAEGNSCETQQALTDARDELSLILNALQFQDITSQQIEATKSMLAGLQGGLVSLVTGLGEDAEDVETIEVQRGTFDPNASFDRERADVHQDDIDKIVAGNGAMPAPGKSEPMEHIAPQPLPEQDAEEPSEADQATDTDGEGDAVSQADIDALLNG